MGRRRDWVVLAASLAAHVGLFAAWLSTRPDPAPIEPPAMEVRIVRLPPPLARPSPPRPSRQAPKRPTETISAPPIPETPPKPPPAAAATRLATDEDLLAAVRPSARQLRDAGIKAGSWDRTPRPPRPRCKPAEGYPGPPLPCPGELMKDPSRPFDVDRDAPNSELAREGRYKRAMKAYHEAPGGNGYPGIACAIFHQC